MMTRQLLSCACVLALVPTHAIAAIGNRAVAEINTSGNANNGAWFNPDNPNFATDLATDTNTANTSAPVVSSASYSFAAGDTSYKLFVQDGSTGWFADDYAGYGCWYPITSISAGKATIDASIGAVVCGDPTKGMPSPRFTVNTVAGVSGSATVTGGKWTLDKTQQPAAVSNGTDLASTNGTTNPCAVTSATYTFNVSDRGNGLRMQTTGTGGTVGWYEVVNTSGGAATLDRACGTAATISGATWRFGGAFALGGGNDDAFFETATAANGTGAGRIFVKSGTHVPNGVISIAAAGGSQAPIIIEGYNALRGDRPTGSTRPELSFGTNSLVLAASWELYNLHITGSPSTLVTGGTNSKFTNLKLVNVSTAVAGRNAINLFQDNQVLGCEVVSIRGRAILVSSHNTRIIGNYIHSSDIGILYSTSTQTNVLYNLVEDVGTLAIHVNAAASNSAVFWGNTLVGYPTPRGTGMQFITATTDLSLLNNIIYGFTTGVTHADTQFVAYSDFNDFYNNTTNRTNVQVGPNDKALDPQFTSLSSIDGTAGAFTAGNDRLVDTTKNFSSLGVVANQDWVYIISGTGSTTTTFYPVTSITTTTNPNDTLVLGVAPGTNTTADKVYAITTGRNYAIGTNLKALGFPGAFPAGYTTGYLDIGGVQRQEAGSGGGTRIY